MSSYVGIRTININEDLLSMLTRIKAFNNWKKVTICSGFAFVLLGTVFTSVTLAAPGPKPVSLVMESGSGSISAYGPGGPTANPAPVEFTYGQVRHVSLTVGWESEEDNSQGELFAGPYWHDSASGLVGSIYIWDTSFMRPSVADDTPPHIEYQTVEFDTDHWGIYLKSFDTAEKTAYYKYTVTYPKP